MKVSYWTPLKALYTYGGQKYWLMRCICGQEKELTYSSYKYLKSLSCGCMRKNRSKISEVVHSKP